MVIPGVMVLWRRYKNITHDNYRLRICVAFFICDVLKRVAAPADAKTCKSAEPQLLAANTKTERQEISRGSALASQTIDHKVSVLLTYGRGESPCAEGRKQHGI